MRTPAMIDLFATSVSALRRCRYSYGGRVFVTEANPLGLAVARAALRYGALGVTVGCETQSACAAVEAMGMDAVLSGDGAAVERARETARGRGFDFAFETSGKNENYDRILELVKRGATVGILVRPERPHTFFVKTAIRSQIRFVGVHSASEEDRLEARKLAADAREEDLFLEMR